MPKVIRENVRKLRTGFKVGMGHRYAEVGVLSSAKGRVFFEMRDARTGELQLEQAVDNVVTLDAGLLVARLMKDNTEPNHGINMLGVGTGALGAILNPDAPSNEQRRLNNEIARKPFSETTFRDSNGAAVAIPTNVVDFTTIYGESEAVGPLNEMGLLSTISDNTATINNNPNDAGQGGQPYDPTIDVTNYDILVNYLTFSVISKPATSILTITWRLTF
jgi:hypothetical protein